MSGLTQNTTYNEPAPNSASCQSLWKVQKCNNCDKYKISFLYVTIGGIFHSCIDIYSYSCLHPLSNERKSMFKSGDSRAVWTWVWTWKYLKWTLHYLHDVIYGTHCGPDWSFFFFFYTMGKPRLVQSLYTVLIFFCWHHVQSTTSTKSLFFMSP